MTLRKRIAQLEAQHGARPDPEAQGAAFWDWLVREMGRTEAHVVATGDLSDDPRASPMERTVRRLLRGDVPLMEGLHDFVHRRWPTEWRPKGGT